MALCRKLACKSLWRREKANMSIIFKNISFHNVEELKLCDGGWEMYRIPDRIRSMISGSQVSRFSTGVELRFRIKGDSVTLILRSEAAEEAQTAYIYYGTFQGGWQNSSRAILTQDTRIKIEAPSNIREMQKIYKEQNLAFDPEVVRVVLPYGTCIFVGVEGEVEPPRPEELPLKTYLAYGSSITHGSLALAAPYSYPFRIAQKMGCDYINLGMAGTAHLEKEMAAYIISRRDWAFASVEMGINMLGENFSIGLFEERVKRFLKILSTDNRRIFVTNLFGFNGKGQDKAKKYREIVCGYADRYSSSNLIFIDGLKLLNNPSYISQDLTHPSLEGLEEISNNWYRVMKQVL